MSEPATEATVKQWLVEPYPDDVAASLRRLVRAGDVSYIAVMPDVHLANDVCVGTVVATGQRLYPAAVGGDIGCGMAAVRIEGDATLLPSEPIALAILNGLRQVVPTHRHRQQQLPDELVAAPLSDSKLERLKLREGRVQFGTLGRGNHFLELQADQQNQLWLLIHSGSRAMGQAITACHVERASRDRSGLVFLDAHSPVGKAYLADVAWALRYAELNRYAMLLAVEKLLQQTLGVSCLPDTYFDAHHNHVRYEEHHGERLLVHRKGAQSAVAGEAGVIPGSMGTASFHVVGRGCAQSLCSSSHGAGRKLSRGDARKSIPARQLTRELAGVWFDEKLTSDLREESPSAYKDIFAAMRAQRELTCIVRELRPVLCYKGT